MKKLNYFVILVMISVVILSCNNKQTADNEDSLDSAENVNDRLQTSTNENATEFLMEATSGGIMEVELGKMAENSAESNRVKNFGKMMLDQHAKVNSELMAIAQTKNVVLPEKPGEDHQKLIDDLKSKKGRYFDKQYMKIMIDDHEKDIKEFEQIVNNTKDAEVKAFAGKTLAGLRIHLDSAKAINEAINDTKRGF